MVVEGTGLPDAEYLAEIDDEAPASAAGATAARRLGTVTGHPRGGRGTSGAVFGSDPLRALLAKESRRRR